MDALTPLVVSDLEGTLLDETSYGFAPAHQALRLLDSRGIPLVLASSKTRAGMHAIVAARGRPRPFALIVENGGALLRTDVPGPPRIVVLGASHADLVAALDAIAYETGVR